jgi:putative membrane protein
MNRPITCAALAALVFSSSAALAASQRGAPNAALTATDFVMAAASTDEFERQSARIATQRATDPNVRKLAEQLAADHAKTSAELAAAAARAGVPAPVPKLHPGQERAIEQLRQAMPEDFDKIYLQQQAEVHRDAVGLLKTYATVGDSQPLVAAAEKARPLVERHLWKVFGIQRSFP